MRRSVCHSVKEFYPAYQVWQQHLPYSAVEVPFLPVPGCTVQLGPHSREAVKLPCCAPPRDDAGFE